jgi:DNA-binding GntR family transcriptional regulator
VTGDTDPFPADQFEYVVLVERLTARIERGEFATGRFPTTREIMRRYSVGAGSVKHARQVLQERGYISYIPGKGTFLA